MKRSEIENGMQVVIKSSRLGGRFQIGTVGEVKNKDFHCRGLFEVHTNKDYWYYTAEDVEMISMPSIRRKR